ncbi:MAG: hypothetical protein KAY24_13890, partial [Candidatus Eisenbacteria sp.]|nr:hypothetical protein [Candidatus Eisenbacteria bacterium]
MAGPAAGLSALLLMALGAILPLQASTTSADPGPTFVREVPIPPPGELGPAVSADIPGALTAPPPNPQIGDSWLWWLFIHEGMPHFEQHMCTVRGKTDRGYVVVQDEQWGISILQADVDIILERWENTTIGIHPDNGIYEVDSLYFGDPPDELDNDPRIYIMWFDFGIPADGFFFFFDQYPEGTYPEYHSNECEVLYLNPCNGQSPSGDYMLSVVAHEFEHMIHWKYDENEDTWVDEGMAEFAMWLYGRPDVISSFNTSPDNSLIVWEGNWSDYIKVYLWSLYFYERYGGHDAVYALVHEPANSIYGYEAVLDDFGYTEDFADVFADWTVANFLDDTSIGDGRYGYLGDELPAFSVSGYYSTYPVPNQTRTVNPWAADYYRFAGFGEITSILLGFDGTDYREYAVWGLALHDGGPTQVLRMELDPDTQSGTLGVGGLTNPADEVILVVAALGGYGSASYVFNAETNPAGITDGKPWRPLDPTGLDRSLLSLSAGPNPFRGEVSLRLHWDDAESGTPRVAIHDATGRLIRNLPVSLEAIHEMTVLWDGRDGSGVRMAPGV